MKHISYTSLCIACSAALLLSFTGCSSDTETGKASVVENTTAATAETTAEVASETEEIETQSMAFHEVEDNKETVESQGISANVEAVYISKDHVKQNDEGVDCYPVFFKMKITNDTEDYISCNMLSETFYVEVDGEGFAGNTIRNAVYAVCQFGDNTNTFDDAIEPGKSAEGYVCELVPETFDTVTLVYHPGSGLDDRAAESYEFTFTADEIQDAGDAAQDY